jgi:hypothetical protein
MIDLAVKKVAIVLSYASKSEYVVNNKLIYMDYDMVENALIEVYQDKQNVWIGNNYSIL